MGTNYYIKADIKHNSKHIGKSSNTGPGEYKFIWAIDPIKFMLRLFNHLLDQEIYYTDEYGNDLTTLEILLIIMSAKQYIYSTIGDDFS